MPDDAYWIDTGTPQTYLQANIDILNQRDGRPRPTGEENGSWRHPTSTVDASATLINAVVDRDCYVGANVVLENVVLMPGAVIEEGSYLSWSIIGPEAVIGSFSTLGAICVVGAKQHVARESALSGDVRLGGV
jgi:NDP-sugar pyrophosphorylase family protein